MYPNNLNKYSFLGLRIMGSLIFIIAGLNHLLNPGVPTGRLQKAELGFLATSFASPEILIFLSGIGLLVGGFMLLIGFHTRKVSIFLILILIPITLTIQVGSTGSLGPLFKNIAILGVLIFFAANGAVYYGIDQLLEKRKQVITRLKTGKIAVLGILAATLISAGSYAHTVNFSSFPHRLVEVIKR